MKRYIIFGILIADLILICSAFFGCKAKDDVFHIGVLQWTEKLRPFDRTYKGVLDGLSAKGFKQGVNLKITYRNAEQDKALALKMGRELVKRDVDVIVALGTGSSLAALKATQKKQIPIVFSIVGAPKATGIIRDFDDSGRNITGVSMRVPVRTQFELVKEALPGLKKMGIIYCTEMPQAVSTGKEAAVAASEFGWTRVVVSFPIKELPQLDKTLQTLAQKVGAIYIPTDPILDSPENLKTIIRIADNHRIPVLAVARNSVEEGVLMAIHCDFYEIGRQAADPIVQVLGGVEPRMIPSQLPTMKKLSLNLKKAQQLDIKINRNIIIKANNIFD
jgi:putative tryptophan/tyrosine transport system substrate-binding protein